MLSFLLLVSGSDAPLSTDHLSRLDRWPGHALAHRPAKARMWLAADRRVGFVGWASGSTDGRAGTRWRIGPEGLTAVCGWPWPVPQIADGERSLVDALAARTDTSTPSGLAGLTGAWTVLRIGTDGRGWLAADPDGAAAVHVARDADVVALSDRAELAAGALGEARRLCDAEAWAEHGVRDAGSAWQGTRTVPAGRWLRLSPGRGVELHDPTPHSGPSPAPHELLLSSVEAAARWPGERVVDLHADPAAAVTAAAIRFTDTAARFRFRAVGSDADRRAAARLAGALGVDLEQAPTVSVATPSALESRLRTLLGRCEGTVLPPLLDRLQPAGGALVLHGVSGASGPQVSARIAGAALHLGIGTPFLDPLSAAGSGDQPLPPTSDLLARLAPGGDLEPPASASGDDPVGLGWEHVGPLLAARRPLTDYPIGPEDRQAALRGRLTTDEALDPMARRRAWALLAATLWLDGARPDARNLRPPAQPQPRRSTSVAPPPTLVTGVTSRSLAHLLDLDLPASERRHDPLLGVDVDGPLAELCTTLLLEVDATETDQPEDIEDRLAAEATARHAPTARALLEDRGGILADPRLGLLLPFWTGHVHPEPRLVLVDERPAELSALSRSALTEDLLLQLWFDVVVRTLLGGPLPRVVDPRDVGPVDVPEGVAPRDAAPSPALQLASVVDGMIRELDRDEVAPLLRGLATRSPRRRRPPGATGPDPIVDVVGDLWRESEHLATRARQADAETQALAARLARVEEELAALRGHPAVRLALRLPGTGRPEH